MLVDYNNPVFMYIISILGIGFCIYVIQISYESCLKTITEDEMIQVFENKKEEFHDIDIDIPFHKCSFCKIKIGKQMITYCYMDKSFCSEKCRNIYFQI